MIMIWLIPLAWLAAVIFVLVVAWRAMRAHERVADALEKLTQRKNE
ncbi:MAG: hypothetical protein NTZ09_15655 [Candidatus Hydrogenedentes bacterium]|nr:hypothetical protein [Candidatus Hydrogenedentota bacterium]